MKLLLFVLLTIYQVITTLVVMAGLLLMLPRWMKSKSGNLLTARYPSTPLVNSSSTANCFGLTSQGRFQTRGNGVLALTATELWFKGFMYDLDITIPLSCITSVELVSSHEGKVALGRKLLKVNFHLQQEDSIAFLLPEPEQWQMQIQGLMGR